MADQAGCFYHLVKRPQRHLSQQEAQQRAQYQCADTGPKKIAVYGVDEHLVRIRRTDPVLLHENREVIGRKSVENQPEDKYYQCDHRHIDCQQFQEHALFHGIGSS